MPSKTTKKANRADGGSGSTKFRKLAAALRKFATSFDGAREDYPWGERVVKGPNGKVFVFLGDPYMIDGKLCLTVKLPASRREVLKSPFAKPCGYGLGKHGWVTLRLNPGDEVPPISRMRQWIKESYDSVNGARATKRPAKR
jgi:predicted DNA-binding protein (MmcQ/YjbR family)